MDRVERIDQVAGLSLAEIRALTNASPAFIYDRAMIRARIAELREHLPPGTEIAYSLKANPYEPIVAEMSRALDGADVTSKSELIAALNCGMRPEAIMFAGPAKKADEHRAAIALGVRLCAESVLEIERIAEVARSIGKTAHVMLRLNPDFSLTGASMRMGGAPTQFGLNIHDLPAAWNALKDSAVKFAGIHVYWGSQCLSDGVIVDAQEKTAEFLMEISSDFPEDPEILNLGGGFGIPYSTRDTALNLSAVGTGLAPVHERLRTRFPRCRIFMEFGRYLVGEAGFYVTNVIDRKTSQGVEFVVTDGGMHHFLAATGNLGQKLRRNYRMSIMSEATAAAETDEPFEVVGALCTPIDLLGHKMIGCRMDVGDAVVLHSAGAYGKSASPVGFLSHEPPLEILI